MVARGAQTNFSQFAADIAGKWDTDSANAWVNEKYFTDIVAKAILFKSLDSLIMKQLWYGGYKAQIVTYSIAAFSSLIESTGMHLDLDRIWETQKIGSGVRDQLLVIAEYVNKQIHLTPKQNMNVSQWCKRPECWRQVEKHLPRLSDDAVAEMVSREKEVQRSREAARQEKMDVGIEYQTLIWTKGSDFWKRVKAWNDENSDLTDKEASIVTKAIKIDQGVIPSESQSAVLVKALNRIKSNGFIE